MASSKFRQYDLDRKVDVFIAQCDERMRNANMFTDIGKFHFPRNLKDFIESKAVYAELRWPSVYYSHWMENERVKTEKAQEIFTWERFGNSGTCIFPTINLMEKDINQQVLYRVIERGGNRSGARRGVLFAKEFELDINIPVAYSVDWSDPHLYDFLKPLIPDLDLNTICPTSYFSRSSNNLSNIEEVKLKEVISRLAVWELKRATA